MCLYLYTSFVKQTFVIIITFMSLLVFMITARVDDHHSNIVNTERVTRHEKHSYKLKHACIVQVSEVYLSLVPRL